MFKKFEQFVNESQINESEKDFQTVGSMIDAFLKKSVKSADTEEGPYGETAQASGQLKSGNYFLFGGEGEEGYTNYTIAVTAEEVEDLYDTEEEDAISWFEFEIEENGNNKKAIQDLKRFLSKVK